MKEEKTIKVAVFQEVLPDYRIAFFNYLGESTDLRVYYSHATSVKNIKPDLSKVNAFHAIAMGRAGSWDGLISWHPELFQHLGKHPPDLIIAEPRLGILTAWALAFSPIYRSKLVWWLSGHQPEEPGWRSSIRHWIRTILYRRAKGIIAYGSETKKYLLKHGIDQNIHIAYNAVDTIAIQHEVRTWMKHPDIENRRQKIRSGANIVLLFSGRFTPEKNIPLLLDTLDYLQGLTEPIQIKLVLIGDGPVLSEIKRQIQAKKMEGKVMLTGSIIDIEQITPYFLAADIFVLPGKGGLALNQAIHFGLPVVLFNADGTEKDMVEDGVNGCFASTQDRKGFASALLPIIKDTDLREKMGKESIRIANERSNMENMRTGFLDAINSLVQTPD